MSDEVLSAPWPKLLPESLVRQHDTHRLIPAKYTPDGSSVLGRIANDYSHLQDLFLLDYATNQRLWGENDLLPGIGRDELVFHVPNSHIVNATFTHAHPLGSRFNGPDRGAWYAGFTLATAQAEIAFHKSIEYAEIAYFQDSVTYDDYLADFSASFHDVRDRDAFGDILAPDSYRASQALAERLLAAGSAGVVYGSVRHPGGTCIACFRPSLVGNVRKSHRYRFVWDGEAMPTIVSAANTG